MALLLVSHLIILGCDSISGVADGKSCYLDGEKLEVLIDANGDEWPISGEKLGNLGEVCVVSRKAVTFEVGFSDHLLSEQGEQIRISPWDQFYWMVELAQWVKPPEGWEDS